MPVRFCFFSLCHFVLITRRVILVLRISIIALRFELSSAKKEGEDNLRENKELCSHIFQSGNGNSSNGDMFQSVKRN